MTSQSIWVLAADGDQACLYQLNEVQKMIPMSGSEKHRYFEEKIELELEPVPDITLRAEKLYDYDQGFDKHGSPIHTVEAHQSTHEELKLRFMRTIALKLNHAFARGLFDKLVIVVPAHLLGEVRKHLDPDVMDCVIAELHKELVPCEAKELLNHIRPTLVSFNPQAA